MPTRFAAAVITLKHRYVCPSCRLQNAPLAGGQTTRYQHSGPRANVGGDTNPESIPKDLRTYNESQSQSHVEDLIRGFLFSQKEIDKVIKGDLRNESLGKDEHSPRVPENRLSTAPQPRDSTDVLQQNLQQKFAAQRRKDMLAMRASQASKAAEEINDMPQARFVSESTKWVPRKSATRAEKSEKAALGSKAIKLSKKMQAKQIDLDQVKFAEIAAFAIQRGEESPTSIKASAEKVGETSGAEGKEANHEDSTGSVSGKHGAITQKLDDIMDILESSKRNRRRLKRIVKPAKMASGTKPISKDTKLKRGALVLLNDLHNRRTLLDLNSRKADARILQSSSQVLAPPKVTSGETSRLFDKLKSQGLLKGAISEDDPPLSKATDKSPLSSSMKANLKERPPRRRIIRKILKDTVQDPKQTKLKPHFKSLQAALLQKSGKVKGEDLESLQVSKAQKAKATPKSPLEQARKSKGSDEAPIEMVTASDLEILPVTVDQPPVPRLAYGLERVLFNPGVYQLQDPRSRVFNFDPYLQKIMPIAEFDFNALKEYITSSRDESLNKIAKEHGKRYMGSTSSMTEVLAQFHFLLSQWRPINPSMLSKAFPAGLTSFSDIQRTPSAIFLRWKDGSYAIDADKQFANANVLTMLGKSVEKLLTLSTDDFERYRRSTPGLVTEDERSAPESYHYSTLGDFLMRSQLDAHDPRLPGTGVFDLKTRSVVSIRMDVANYEHGVGYEIKSRQGEWESYEREYYDMIRAAFLKYSLQVRMGRMDGIFVAFHNIERIFGFQYISLPEMDCTLHGQRDTSIGDQEFRLSLDLMNKVLDRATKKYPETSLRIFFETRETQSPFMYVFAEPVTEEQVAEVQSQNSAKIQEFERNILGLTRGNGSGTDDTKEVDPDWEKIQADVQKAMEKDELSADKSGQDQEAIDENVGGTTLTPSRPEVFEQGPLYGSKSAARADDHATAGSVANEEDEGDGKDDDEIDGEDECEEDGEEEEKKEDGEEEEKKEDGDVNADGGVEESTPQEGLDEFLEAKPDINAINAVQVEREVSEDGTDDNNIALSHDYPVKVNNDANLPREEPNEDDTTGQESVDDTIEPTDDRENTGMSPDAVSSSIAERESQQELRTRADGRFLDLINQENVQADTAAESSPSEDILAMTLTIRNKVNGQYVLRPETMNETDEWSIEYSLTEVSAQGRARKLYEACRARRKKKMDPPEVPEDAELISAYIKRLRELSMKGRRWRKQQDMMDRERPVEVLSERDGEGGVHNLKPEA